MTLAEFLAARIAEDADLAVSQMSEAEVEAWRLEAVPIPPTHGRAVRFTTSLEPLSPPAVADLRLLALPYADNPDYRAEWKP